MKTVAIALPGREFSGNFLKNWSQTLLTLTQKGYKIIMMNEYSSFVSILKNEDTRSRCSARCDTSTI
jgi:hypothetical protein